MDTNFNLNLFLVTILLIIYCFSESDLKVENFQDSKKKQNKEKNQKGNKEENREVKSEDEKEEVVNARNDYLKKTAALEKKYTSNSESSIETMNQYQKSLKSLSSVSKSAETQAQKSLNDAINTANGNNKEQKEPKKTSIMGDVSDYTKRINSSQFINTKSLNSRENNPPNNIPLPQELNNTRYGLFNKYNLPPSSRPNVIDIFDNTDSLNDNVIKQDELSGNGNIFLPKLVMS